mmetsp:Transcript_107405/g.149726  ORF Transcript_107405/g.149726 Transcript_107405/m.149726 type:complete len:250 (-) Transcript_107405:49-798(-)
MARFLLLALVFLGAQATKKSVRPEEEAFLELDTDHSGKVEFSELEAFGKSKGLSNAQISEEFSNMDLNHNGIIEVEELERSLLAAAAPGGEDVLPPPVQQAKTAPAIVETVGAARKQRSELQEMDHAVEHSAGRALAELFERKAAQALVQMQKDSHEAEVLESRAKTLRGKAHRLQQGIHGVIASAAKNVADEILKKTVHEVNLMSQEVKLAEENALQSQELASEAMQKAKAAEHAMSSEVRRMKQASE